MLVMPTRSKARANRPSLTEPRTIRFVFAHVGLL